jgi:hypothetical protein
VSVGHGSPGLLSGLKPFSDLVYDSAAHRRPYVEVQLGLEVTSWQHVSGFVWVALFHNVIDRVLRDVVGVQVSPGGGPMQTLSRVQELTDLNTVTGYFADIDAARIADETFDSDLGGDSPVPIGDKYPPLDLYLRMPDNSQPSAGHVMALMAFRYSTQGEIHPVLGEELLINANLEDWSIPTQPQTWSVVTVNGSQSSPPTVNQDSTIFAEGRYSARIDGFLDTNRGRGISLPCKVVRSKRYVLSLYYRTPANLHPALEPRINIQEPTGNFYVLQDGLTVTSSAVGIPLAPTYGEWRTAFFEVVGFGAAASANYTITMFLFNNGGGGSIYGQMWIDRTSFKRKYRDEFYEPRIAGGEGLELELGTNSPYWDRKPVGLGDLILANNDLALYPVFGGLRVANRTVTLRVGGNHSDGQEVLAHDWRAQFPGLISSPPDANDSAVRLRLDDMRNRMHRPIPVHNFTRSQFPNMDPRKVNKPIPVTFAFIAASPTRIDRNANGYGIYLVTDPFFGPVTDAGAPADGVFTHPTDDDRRREFNIHALTRDVHWRYVPGTSFTQIEFLTDVRDLRFLRDGTQIGDVAKFDFDVGGATLTATINMSGPVMDVCAVLQAAMRAVPGSNATILVTHDDATHRVRVRRGDAGAINLRGETGPNASFNYWQYLGFSSGDKITTNDYTGENVLFTDADRDTIFEMLAYGYTDGLGLITGIFGSLIKLHSHVGQRILMDFMGVQFAKIDRPTWNAAAALETGVSGANNDHAWLYLEEQTDTAEVLGRIELGMGGDIVADGEGVWYFIVNELETTSIASFSDDDYLEWQMGYDPTYTYETIRVEHAWSPNRERPEIIELSDARAALLEGANRTLSLKTMSASSSTQPDHRPMKVARRHRKLATSSPRWARFAVAGRLADALPGRKITLSRTGALDPTGNLVNVRFRIRRLIHNFLRGVSRCVAVEDINLDS